MTGASTGQWRRRLRREIGWILLVKVAVLATLWTLFFSPEHRVRPDDEAISDRLAITAPASAPQQRGADQ